jgi:regulator of protease activity HflC (stomatin/prohibitin superfamily)
MRVLMPKIRKYERGLLFRNREFRAVLAPGRHVVVDPLWNTRVERVSTRDAFLNHRELDVIAKSGALGSDAQVLDLAQHERALVWLNGRFSAVVPPGLTAIWTEFHEVRAEVVDAREIRFVHPEQRFILASPTASAQLEQVSVDAEHRALVFVDGELTEELGPGAYAFWRDVARVKVLQVDLREQVLDVSGQEIMTADKVTLRLNALVTFRVTDARQAVTATGDHEQALYRQAQLAVREVIGGRDLESLLVDRQAVSADLLGEVRQRSKGLGVAVDALGIRDVILPGDMRELLNRVTEARAAAQAALIHRREETAAMRSQANTAKLLESNPTLMRLRELEVLESVADKAQLTVVMGEGSLADRVVKLL